MRIETILNALIESHTDYAADWIVIPQNWINFLDRRKRQRNTFRVRILREFAILRNFAEVNGFDRTQAWFWTDEWQAKEREVDEYLDTNKVQSFDTMENFLNTLEHEDD